MKRIFIYLAEGFEEIEAITVIDVLRRGGVTAETVSIKTEKVVKGAHGISIGADLTIEESIGIKADGHVLPGGMPGTENLLKSELLKNELTKEKDAGKLMGAICAAPSVYGRWGFLEGKTATCYPGFEKMLLGARPSTEEVVKDGIFLTSKGPGTAMEFALALVKELEGKTKMEEVKAGLLYRS